MTLTAALKILALFVPELTPQMIAAILADDAEAQKAEIIIQPVIDRLQNNGDAFLEEAQAYEQLQAPEYKTAVVSAFKLIQQFRAILAAYAAKIEGATQ
jgi:hypothetical protein